MNVRVTIWFWYDDDGVIRCDACHANAATAWGGDYDYWCRNTDQENDF